MPRTSKPKAAATPVRKKPKSLSLRSAQAKPPLSIADDTKLRETLEAGSPGFLISSTARILGRSLASALREHGVAPGQWSVMRHLWAEEGLSQRELSILIGIEEATLTRTIDRLVRDKLAVRRPNITNGRQHAIYLSERGRQLRDVLVPLVERVNRRATRRMSSEALRSLVENLTLIRNTVEDDLKKEAARLSAARSHRPRASR